MSLHETWIGVNNVYEFNKFLVNWKLCRTHLHMYIRLPQWLNQFLSSKRSRLSAIQYFDCRAFHLRQRPRIIAGYEARHLRLGQPDMPRSLRDNTSLNGTFFSRSLSVPCIGQDGPCIRKMPMLEQITSRVYYSLT